MYGWLYENTFLVEFLTRHHSEQLQSMSVLWRILKHLKQLQFHSILCFMSPLIQMPLYLHFLQLSLCQMHLEILSQWLADSPMPSQIKLPNHFIGYPSNLTFDQTLIAKASSFFSFLFIFPNTSRHGQQRQYQACWQIIEMLLYNAEACPACMSEIEMGLSTHININ